MIKIVIVVIIAGTDVVSVFDVFVDSGIAVIVAVDIAAVVLRVSSGYRHGSLALMFLRGTLLELVLLDGIIWRRRGLFLD